MSNKYRKTIRKKNIFPYAAQAVRKAQSRKYFLKKRVRRIKVCLLVILIILVLGTITYFLFFSKFCQIKNIKIIKLNDNNLISEQELKDIATPLINKKTFIFSQNNITLFKSKYLSEIMSKDSRIESFKIDKKWPNNLIIEMEESEPVALLVSLGNNKNCYLNPRGQIIYASTQDFVKTDLPLFYDQTLVNLDNPSYVEVLKNALDLIKSDVLSQNEIKADLVKISEKAGIFELEITTCQEWKILINSEADFSKQIANLGLILKEKIRDRKNLEQIDLRFGEKIFYKLLKNNQ